jgi:hypothetical protein
MNTNSDRETSTHPFRNLDLATLDTTTQKRQRHSIPPYRAVIMDRETVDSHGTKTKKTWTHEDNVCPQLVSEGGLADVGSRKRGPIKKTMKKTWYLHWFVACSPAGLSSNKNQREPALGQTWVLTLQTTLFLPFLKIFRCSHKIDITEFVLYLLRQNEQPKYC